MSFRWNLGLAVTTCLVGVALLLLFVSLGAAGSKSISLFFAVAFILSGIFRLLNFLFISLPEGHCKRLASSIAVFSAGLFYILHGGSVVWTALSWMLLVGGLWATVSGLQHILLERAMLQALLKAYERNEFPSLPVPFAYILAEPGWGVYHSHRLVAKIMSSLWKHRYLPAESGLSVYKPLSGKKRSNFLWKHRRRGMLLFLVSDSVRRYACSFRKWLASQAAAFIVFRTPVELNESLMKTFDEEVKTGYQMCPGPTFMIYFRYPRGDNSTGLKSTADQALECSLGVMGHQFDNVIAPLVNRLASTALPIAASDARLSNEVRSLIQEIGTCALPPIADCYLRLRLAQSDVERFLSSLNCIESLVRCSVITVLVSHWKHIGTDVSNKQLTSRAPTLGSWIDLLQSLTNMVVRDDFAKELCALWRGDMLESQAQLISEMSKTDLPLRESRRSSQLDWLKWFRDLRNVTRGHGVVTEKSVAPLWHLLHETVLEMISGLRPLALSSVVVAREPNGKQISLKGWLRGGNRRVSQDFQEPYELGPLVALELPSSQLLPLHPLVIVRGHGVLVWDRLRNQEKAIEFLNYASWEREKIPFSRFSGTDPYKIWERSKVQGTC